LFRNRGSGQSTSLTLSLTPEGTAFVGHQQGQHMIYDGNSIVALGPDESPAIYELSGGSLTLRRLIKSRRYAYPCEQITTSLSKRALWKQLLTPDLADLDLYSLLLTPDGKSHFYTYNRELSTLFLAVGLKQIC
jgi:hypothetical protein